VVADGKRDGGMTASIEAVTASQNELLAEVAERKRTEEVLRESEHKFLTIYQSAPFAMALLTLPEAVIVDVNNMWLELFGYGREEVTGKTSLELGIHRDPQHRADILKELQQHGAVRNVVTHAFTKSGGSLVVSRSMDMVEFSGKKFLLTTIDNITEQKRAEVERETAVDFLHLVNESRSTDDLIRTATMFFQERSGCEAVGLRLRQGHDYPYYEALGFPREFVLRENRVCTQDINGRPVLDSRGEPLLECLCGNVICGRFDPSRPFFTEKGSFWTNSTTELLASTTEADRQARTRNHCHGEGYESVALIALRSGAARLGLLQLNDRRKGRFTPETIALWERLADYLAVALTKFRSEEALQHSLRRFELLADTAGKLLRASEPQKAVESVCRSVMEYLDCQAFFNFLVNEEAGKLHLNACTGIPGEEARRIEWLDYGIAVCGCAARDGERIVAEYIPTTPDERTELVKSYGIKAYACHPLLGPGGKVLGTLSFGTSRRETFSADDLSLMKAVTDQVATAMTRLNDEQALRKNVTELAAVNRELESFIYSISHDLRQPLRAMSVFSQILADNYTSHLDERGKNYLSRIHHGTEKMAMLIDDLLLLSQIARQEIERREVNLSELAAGIIKELQEASPGRNIRIDIAKNLNVEADRRLMEVTLANLFENAWKFTSYTKQARIEFGAAENEGGTVYAVRDNGAGFDPEYKEKMFWPFHRLHSDDEFEGTGIGLAIVERIIRRHNGKVWAEGDVGKGATVYFTLG